MLGSSSTSPRTKRTLSSQHSSKLSVKDLALELAKKHVSLKKKIVYLQRHNEDSNNNTPARKAFSSREELLSGGQNTENNQL